MLSKVKRNFRTSPVVVLQLSLVFFFQNCEKRLLNSDQDAPSESDSSIAINVESSGNGHGYGGKLYSLELSSGVCANGSSIESQILYQGNVHYLVRENCVTLAVALPIHVQIDPGLKSVQYNGRDYFETISGVPQSFEMKNSGVGSTENGSAKVESTVAPKGNGNPTPTPTPKPDVTPAPTSCASEYDTKNWGGWMADNVDEQVPSLISGGTYPYGAHDSLGNHATLKMSCSNGQWSTKL